MTLKLNTLVTLSKALLSLILFVGCGSGESSKVLQSLETRPIEKGELSVAISATGTVEPVEIVDIGAQIVGQILELGNDINGKRIDYGSIVEEGAVLARIDDRLYQADARLAEATVRRNKAELQRSRAALYIAERDWNRAQKIGASEALSQSSFDTYRSNYEVATAVVVAAEAAVVQSEATLNRALLNVQFCTIKSPVKGTIVDKRVNIGQTVVSSFNAPSLFLLAKDLTKIQVWVSVNEADISSLFPGQSATFSVDAYPGEEFKGRVNKIRLNATMVQNVVSYIVEVDTDNPDGKLLPYLTANVRFEVGTVKDSLLVPNSALRFMPTKEQFPGIGKLEPSKERIFVLESNKIKPVTVVTGLTDGFTTTIQSELLKAGDQVITGMNQSGAPEKSKAVNPFVPNISGGRPRP